MVIMICVALIVLPTQVSNDDNKVLRSNNKLLRDGHLLYRGVWRLCGEHLAQSALHGYHDLRSSYCAAYASKFLFLFFSHI